MSESSPFGKDNLGGAVDLRVKVCSPLGGHKQGDTGTASTYLHGTSRSSSRGRGGGRSCRGGIEEAAETRLNEFGPNLCSLSTSGGWKSDNWVENRVKSPWES